MTNHDVVISCRSLWKVFGPKPLDALKAIRERQMNKVEAFRDFQAVVGVANVSFDVRKGEIFCIMGLSGSGKSTLIRHINRLIEPTEGTICINGTEVNKLNRNELRKLRAEQISMVFQSVALLPYRNVLENAALGLEFKKVPKSERQAVAQRALEIVHLAEWSHRYPNELSGGMMQRVGLARAIANDTNILLMDEPFSALDPLIRRELQNQFVELTRSFGKTAVFITHDLEEAVRIGNRIAIMRDGAVVQVGTPEQIIMEPADEYIARFTSGIAKNDLVRARSLMIPIVDYCAHGPGDRIDSLPRVSSLATIDETIEVFLRHGETPLAVDHENRIVGVISVAALLRGLQGRAPSSGFATKH